MSEASDLFRGRDPDTSRIAAQKLDRSKWERTVLDVIKSFGDHGCTSDEVRDKLPGAAYSSVTARYKALMDKGLIKEIGTRPGASGRQQRIMRAA